MQTDIPPGGNGASRPLSRAPAQREALAFLDGADRQAIFRGQLWIVLIRVRFDLPMGGAVENLLRVAEAA